MIVSVDSLIMYLLHRSVVATIYKIFSLLNTPHFVIFIVLIERFDCLCVDKAVL
jgi:hypothetical protein